MEIHKKQEVRLKFEDSLKPNYVSGILIEDGESVFQEYKILKQRPVKDIFHEWSPVCIVFQLVIAVGTVAQELFVKFDCNNMSSMILEKM
ncbi:MAG: hypothetical protein K6B68_03755 [Eubacterium sp.]|nr:hypothetical protein [Eubacterium sp.]